MRRLELWISTTLGGAVIGPYRASVARTIRSCSCRSAGVGDWIRRRRSCRLVLRLCTTEPSTASHSQPAGAALLREDVLCCRHGACWTLWWSMGGARGRGGSWTSPRPVGRSALASDARAGSVAITARSSQRAANGVAQQLGAGVPDAEVTVDLTGGVDEDAEGVPPGGAQWVQRQGDLAGQRPVADARAGRPAAALGGRGDARLERVARRGGDAERCGLLVDDAAEIAGAVEHQLVEVSRAGVDRAPVAVDS